MTSTTTRHEIWNLFQLMEENVNDKTNLTNIGPTYVMERYIAIDAAKTVSNQVVQVLYIDLIIHEIR